jgi:hypothetical protein
MADAPQAPPPLSFPLGINNRDRETALSVGAARVCDNLDVTRDGSLLSRKGLRPVETGVAHSVWAHPSQRFLLLVLDGQLTRMDGEGETTSLGFVSGPVVYAVLNDDVFWSDGHAIGRITAGGEEGIWGLSVPPVPVVSAVASGGLHAGTYQVAMTAIISAGPESGVAETVSVDVPEGGGIQVTTPAASGVVFAFYRTPANGSRDDLRAALMVTPGSTAVIGGEWLGRPLESLHAIKPLPCQHLLAHKGRLWGASDNVLWFTSERSPHWLFPVTGYYQFESAVTMLGASEDGIFVGLYDRVYYLQGGDPAQMTQRPVSSVGATYGSGTEVPYDLFVGQGSFPSRQWAWWDTEGFLCLGKPGGIVVRPTQDHYSAGLVSAGVMRYRRNDGMRQLVAGLTPGPAHPLHATDTEVATIFANGVVLNA